MTHPTKPTAGPPALSSPVEDDKARAEKLWNGLHRAEDDPWCDDQDKLAIAVEFARIRAEAVAAEREACAQVAEMFRGKDYPECAEHIADDIRARGPAPAQQAEGGDGE